jgi:hypothetical protein
MGKGYEGFDAMYTGKPSKPGKTQVQIGYGIVKGDGVGFEDVANSKQTGKITYGAVDGKRRKVEDELEQS